MINSRYLMIASTLVLAAMGLVISFAPAEAWAYIDGSNTAGMPVILQLVGALYLGFAFTNWSAKGMVLGAFMADRSCWATSCTSPWAHSRRFAR